MSSSLLPTTTTMARNNSSSSEKIRSRKNKKKNWMEEMRGSLLIVATVIATLTFQIAINPPGGVWQEDSGEDKGCAPNTTCKAGTSVLAFGSSDLQTYYELFMMLCTISFLFSLTIILFLISGIPFSNRFVMWGFIITMGISVMCLAGSYIVAFMMVTNPFDSNPLLLKVTKYCAYFLGGVIALWCLCLSLRFLFWLVKMFYRCLFHVQK